ncbi:hypothetical protein [Planotetraspora sp. GP83]|uniref:hypothetical protein n=1 Tax=Planotetraspora sp. GP83 TaxID=3156264 RepID=UPI0035150747
MTISPATSLYPHHELVDERIRNLHREAEQERLASRIRSVRKARRQVERASERLRYALSRV